jgi:hypothetical protein
MQSKTDSHRSFFRTGEAQCPIYTRTRDSPEEHNIRARTILEELWQECAPYIDADAADKATRDMVSVFWELYPAHALMQSGLRLERRVDRLEGREGPDLLATEPTVWMEAVAPRSGEGTDALQPPPLGVAYTIPTDKFVLRLRNAIEVKAERIANYIKQGYIKQTDATVVAISSARLEFGWSELPTPRIISAVFGTGAQVILLNKQTAVREGTYLEFKGEISKDSGSVVSTDIFLRPEYKHISAVLYSPSNWQDIGKPAGSEFVIVHNPSAAVPLPPGWLPVATEYRIVGSTLIRDR